ncbi:MAG: ferrous iron transporter B [Candidatus Hydrogenedentes bacterium]|nr:ferrous iron transporter B [Candidatus Hydrogenedentota bacterium]
MDAIDALFGSLGEVVSSALPEGALRSLIVDGAIAGVGGVLVFLPQILFLSLFIAVLEDCGYMARAAFLMDKLLSWCGLSGQSFIPMFTSFACAIPGVMATRVIRNWRDRFTTILVAPLMSCSARLPVYIIMIEAFLPEREIIGGFLTTHGLALFAMYLLGMVVAVPVAYILKKTFFRGHKPPFLLEMPSYKLPQGGTVLRKVLGEGKEFVVRAGTLIFAVAIIVWALAYFPRSEEIGSQFDQERSAVAAAVPAGDAQEEALAAVDAAEAGAYLRGSYLGQAGHLIEPIFTPLGWDWRIATATIASFPAREIILANLATLFNRGAEDESSLKDALRTATHEDGTPLFSVAVALSVMVFFALCCQCAATLAIIKRETGKWRWPALTFGYMTGIAYVAALLTYHGAVALGLG